MKALFLAVLAAMSMGLAMAGDYEDGEAAYMRNDYATALKLWTPFVAQGYACAQYNLGLMYRNGRGVPQEYAEAVRWYKLAATQGQAALQAHN